MKLFLIGIVSGIVSGMGIGGGAILIPALVMFVKPPQHIAQSVNLLYFIPTAIVALIIHIKNKKIDFKIAVPIIIFGLFGAYIGSQIAVNLSEDTLRKCFGVFLFLIGINEMIRKDGKNKIKKNKDKIKK
ncbi:sulfite exporter TauE/SafE family protein [Acetivibrio saccincola]|jgi:uncharacterized membrane protein YfcA|uniref:Probable membrane transporter protein n=1 Tax=Acetivibrio saccincola TaxID=1677857 RepID=A0A2K9E1P6_9FIRM|nr:sulfite exporter TauE/SafE family protein [Acetivibrio saccincola]AUG57319.1 hypothetical protein HVS_07010 [Acetivibrio saccincola]NLW26195.1 sulfite exporter TauE/SafE family protein [Acetivibrio saccincola]PQQ67257.1 permease [Acetivibrio saccincola]HOA96314.1 sulfite exporter TauE/SafE family protein [Acetivibrio saccincola]HQD29174.1 sulfite exporter TauE/SafE family protein [Acetivibrio saccincola]